MTKTKKSKKKTVLKFTNLSPEQREKKAHFTKKKVFKFKMRNLSFLSKNPDRRLHKLEEEKGGYFPPHIRAIKDLALREQMMTAYSELAAQLQLQRRYKRHNCQSEPSLIKLSKKLGLFPARYTTNDPEVHEWEKRMECIRRKRAERRLVAKAAATRHKRAKQNRMTYAQVLALQLRREYGVEPMKPRGRKPKKVRVVFVHRQYDGCNTPDYKLVDN